MTNAPRRPSIPQAHAQKPSPSSTISSSPPPSKIADAAADVHDHLHAHKHRSPSRSEYHQQHYRRYHSDHQQYQRRAPDAASGIAADAPPPDNVDSFATHVVQTVSVVTVLDEFGAPVGLETRIADPATVVVDPENGTTVKVPDSNPTDPDDQILPAPTPDPDSLPQSPPAPESSPDTSEGDDSADSVAPPTDDPSSPGFSESSGDSEVTPNPTSDDPLPTISAVSNSTDPSLPDPASSYNSTSSVGILADSESISSTSSHVSLSSTVSSFSSYVTVSDSQTTTVTISTSSSTSLFTSSTQSSLSSPSPTQNGAETGVAGIGGNEDAEPTSSAAASPNGGDESPPEPGMIVGSVLGSLAGVALLAVLVLLALRWKKRNSDRLALGDDVSRSGAGAGTSGGDGSDGMVQRSLGFGSAALAAASAKRSSRKAPPADAGGESGERGFYRVSGRKLPPVITAGGDGYTDPRGSPDYGGSSNNNDPNETSYFNNRESGMSDESVFYRESQTFFDDERVANANGGRLALGSPMRPVSGVPVMRSGPARMPTTENPFEDPVSSPPNLSPPARDGVGRSLGAHDGSRGSGSKFQEQLH